MGVKAAVRKPLPHTGRRWPASGAPAGETDLFDVLPLGSRERRVCSGSTFTVRQYVTTMMTSGMKKATKEPISMKRSSLRTQLPLTKTLSSLRRPITGIGIDTP